MEVTYLTYALVWISIGVIVGLLVFYGLPSFLSWAWKNTKDVLGKVVGIVGAAAIILFGLWLVGIQVSFSLPPTPW